LAALAIAGCGTSQSASGTPTADGAKATVRDFLTSLAHPSGRICDFLTQGYIERRQHAKGASAVEKCRNKADRAKGQGVAVTRIRFTSATVHGNEADVAVSSSATGALDVHHQFERGRWRIDSGLGNG
jgi:hypothetical protein